MYKAPSLPTYYINNAPSQVGCLVCLLLHLRNGNGFLYEVTDWVVLFVLETECSQFIKVYLIG